MNTPSKMLHDISKKLLVVALMLVVVSCGDGSGSSSGVDDDPVQEIVEVESRVQFRSSPPTIVILDPDQSDSSGELFLCQISFGSQAELRYELSADGSTLTLEGEELSLVGSLDRDVKAIEGVPNALLKQWAFPETTQDGVRRKIEVLISDETIIFRNTCRQ